VQDHDRRDEVEAQAI
jgi:glycogen phosphorylase